MFVYSTYIRTIKYKTYLQNIWKDQKINKSLKIQMKVNTHTISLFLFADRSIQKDFKIITWVSFEILNASSVCRQNIQQDLK